VIEATEALDNVQHVTVWNAIRIEPRLVVEADRVNDKRISFPFAHRVPHIRGLEVFGVSPAVRKNLPDDLNLEYEDHAVTGLNDFPRIRKIQDSRHSRRYTSWNRVWRVVRIGRRYFKLVFLVEFLSPGLKWGISIGKNVAMILLLKPYP
jgi:hypothetical protein